MRYELMYQPVFSVARIMLENGESIRAEPGAMMTMSANVELQSKAGGGLGKMLGRMMGGESLFQSTYTATGGPGEVLLVPAGPGDILPMPLQNQSIMVTSGCYLAGDTALDFQTQANMRGFFGGEGLFVIRIAGTGLLLLSAFGAIHPIQLQPGQPYIIDSGHVVAYNEGMQMEVRRASRGLLGSLTSGEGFVFCFTGPGTVYTQTRTPMGFGQFISPFVARGG
ncbi:MAG TPA: TIGR00266 family protein [Fimbriimonadaceae bacterium]|nr:TIGR00266 family protein [Fimbriimonadaceae bacterium]HRJ34036.1 TIGR00266 family protein [Fimbriimonadaceae bacterium]